MANLTPATPEDHPVIHYGLSYKKNTGNFSNITIDASVTDHKRANETVSEAFDRVAAFVEKKFDERVQEMIKAFDG